MDIRLGKKKSIGAYLNNYDDESHWAVGLFDCLDTHLDACTISSFRHRIRLIKLYLFITFIIINLPGAQFWSRGPVGCA